MREIKFRAWDKVHECYQVAPVEKARYFSDEMNQRLGRPPI